MAHNSTEVQQQDLGYSPASAENHQVLFSDAYGVPSDQQKNLDDKIAKDLTPERQSAIQGVLPRLDGIVKSMSKSDVQAFHQSVQKLQSATSMEEYQRGVHEAINSVNDPAAKAQLSKYYEDLYKAMGPELISDLCEQNRLQASTSGRPVMPEGNDQNSYGPVNQGNNLDSYGPPNQYSYAPNVIQTHEESVPTKERQYDDHVDKLMKSGARSTVIAAGHAILEGDLPALQRSLKGSDDKIAALAVDINKGLAAVNNPAQLSTAPGHVFVQLPQGRAIDIDTKKHTAVERSVQVRPDGTTAIDLSSIITGTDASKDFRSLMVNPFSNPGQTRNAWSVDGQARPYYGGPQTDVNVGKWRAPYGQEAPSFVGVQPNPYDSMPGDFAQGGAGAIAERLQNTAQDLGKLAETKDSKEVLKAEDATLQELVKTTDENYTSKIAEREQLEKRLSDSVPPGKKQELLAGLDRAADIIGKLPLLDQFAAITALQQPDSPENAQFLLNHPLLADALKGSIEFMKGAQPVIQKSAEIQQAADERLKAGMMYVNALRKADDPRAKDAFNQMMDGFPQELKDGYFDNPDVRGLGKMVGAKVPPESPQPRDPFDRSHQTIII